LCWMRVGNEREQRCTKRQKRRKRGKASCGPVSASGKHTIKCPFNRESSRSAWGGHHRSLESQGIVASLADQTLQLKPERLSPWFLAASVCGSKIDSTMLGQTVRRWACTCKIDWRLSARQNIFSVGACGHPSAQSSASSTVETKGDGKALGSGYTSCVRCWLGLGGCRRATAVRVFADSRA